MKITVAKANKVYDVLVKIGGAWASDRDSFVYHHCDVKDGCDEWRFAGKLGFGEKYRSQTNSVDYYNEDFTPERKKIIEDINKELSKIK